MDNPVVKSMEKAFFAEGFSTLSFNYTTKQDSALCKTGEKLPDFLDITMVLDWAMQERSEFRCFWIAGVAYGAYLALQITMRRPEILHFVVASAPAWQNDLGFLAPCPVPGLVLQSSQDHSIANAVKAWTQRLSQGSQPVTLQTIPCIENASPDHFNELENAIQQYIKVINIHTGLPRTTDE